MKYNKYSNSQLKKKAIIRFNKKVRDRDRDGDVFFCIACGQCKPVSQMQAGHYYPATVENLRFNEDNVNGECIHCNFYSGDHLIGYRKNLIKKIGLERVEKLDFLAAWYKRNSFKHDRFSLIEKLEKYK